MRRKPIWRQIGRIARTGEITDIAEQSAENPNRHTVFAAIRSLAARREGVPLVWTLECIGWE